MRAAAKAARCILVVSPELDETLVRCSAQAPKQAELVKRRCFTGFTIEEAGEVLGISPATAKRWWTYVGMALYGNHPAAGVTDGLQG